MRVVKDLVEALFHIDRLPFKVVLWIFVVSASVLFSPQWFLERLSLGKIRAEWGFIPGLLFLGSLSLIVVTTGKAFLDWLHRRWKNQLARVEMISKLKNLRKEEAEWLQSVYEAKTDGASVNIATALIAGLLSKGILEESSNIGHPVPRGFQKSVRICDLAQEVWPEMFDSGIASSGGSGSRSTRRMP